MDITEERIYETLDFPGWKPGDRRHSAEPSDCPRMHFLSGLRGLMIAEFEQLL